MAHPGGRPLKFKTEDIIEQTYKYLGDVIDGNVSFPSIERLALKMDMHIDTLYTRAKESPEISEALAKIKEYQKAQLIEGGLEQRYHAGFTKFLLSANHGMSETSKQETNANVTFSWDTDE